MCVRPVEEVEQDVLYIELKDYLTKDCISLNDVMVSASKYIYEQYGVDLSTVFSTSSLAMSIYRTCFITEDIPVLGLQMDKNIREAYYGGATQVFKHYGRNIHYYDVNSLYPWAITQPLPHIYLGKVSARDINPYTFFGFLYADIKAPTNVNPILPWRNLEGKLSYPTGNFSGFNFSEELAPEARVPARRAGT